MTRRPVVGRGERIGRVDAAGILVDEFGQRIRVGAFQFRKAAPVEHGAGQLVALRGQRFQHVGIGRPGAGLGLAAAGDALLVEKDFAELLGRADVEALAGEFVNLVFEARHLLREVG